MTKPPRRYTAADLERLQVEIAPQPDDFACGPTCLQAIYRYWGDPVSLPQVIQDVPKTPSGGTADVFLANHALQRGYRATIHTFNLRIFDPTWFALDREGLADRLRLQAEHKGPQRPVVAMLSEGYLEFLRLGGQLRFVDLTPELLRRYLRRGVPILTGLSATYLYRAVRELETPEGDISDDVRGEPQGHFVVLCGYHPHSQSVMVADPYVRNPIDSSQLYEVTLARAVGAILLGVLTHDANLLMIEPGGYQPAT